MRGAIYARESSDDTERAPPIENQITIGKEWFMKNKHTLAQIYKDDGWSGGDWRRPAWNEMVSDARTRKFAFVWVWSRARIARDVEQHAWFYRNLKERGCRVFAHETQEFLDMETMGGYAKEVGLANANALMRIGTSQAVKRVYEYKSRLAEKTKTKVGWGRLPIPEALASAARNLKELNPSWGIRKIAKELPYYKLKDRFDKNGNLIEGKMRRASYAWVSYALKNTRPKSNKKMRDDTEKENEMINNNPIV
jgi:DNA invertase Pin-like site-specific DNA recombinase